MGVDARASLAPNVRLGDVAKVLGILYGLPSSLEPLRGGGVFCEVRGASTRGFEVIPEMARIELRAPNGDPIAEFNFHWEQPGGRKLLTARSTAKAIAALRRVCEFFGGRLDAADCDDEENDFSSPDLDDGTNCPEDGEEWAAFQRRMAAVQALTKTEIHACADLAAY